MKNQNFFALDLELNNYSGCKTPKIIEVGVAIGSPVGLDGSQWGRITSCNWYLDPGEPIDPFITKLTGITDEVIAKNAVSHQTVAKELGALIDTYQCFPNPVTWGQGDALELKAEFAERRIGFPYFGRRIIDVKERVVFAQIAAGKSPGGGLRKSMGAYGLKFDGTPHRAMDDATNTLRFFFALLHRERNLQQCVDTLKSLH